MTLDALLARAAISRYDVAMWFRNSRLVGSRLIVSDIDDFGCIGRCFETRLREHLPDLAVTFVPPSARE